MLVSFDKVNLSHTTMPIIASHFTRTRIAPTPSGYLHLGNVLSFSITAALAKRYGAKILLRIDDMDRERVQDAYVQDIFKTLHYLSIPWDEGPRDVKEFETTYSQLHRMELYRTALQQLRKTGVLFACDCSRASILRNNEAGVYTGTCVHKQLPLDNVACNWRINTSPAMPFTMHTLHGEEQSKLPAGVDYFVVRKKDGYPAYQLCSVVDDLHFNVDLIVRGEDLRSSTLAQLFLATQLNATPFTSGTFYHHALLMDTGDQKLSKSAGATSIKYLRESGCTPANIFAMTGAMAGISTPVNSWETLGSAALSF